MGGLGSCGCQRRGPPPCVADLGAKVGDKRKCGSGVVESLDQTCDSTNPTCHCDVHDPCNAPSGTGACLSYAVQLPDSGAATAAQDAKGPAATNHPTCGIGRGLTGDVLNVTDGVYARCVSVVRPPRPAAPLPVLFWFHGAGGSAQYCGSFFGKQELGELAAAHGFALVCGEALQDAAAALYGAKGQWQIPEVITDATGTPCGAAGSAETTYIRNVLAALRADPRYDTSRVFFSGCSMGSAFSGYITQCVKAWAPGNVSAFATHSTGLKARGDGLHWPADIYHPEYQTGECPGCQYFPMKPIGYSDPLGLKACIFDNAGDDTAGNAGLGDFYTSSLNLRRAWEGAGNRAEAHFSTGGHCKVHSFANIINCLDDGTGRLLPDGVVPATPAPSAG